MSDPKATGTGALAPMLQFTEIPVLRTTAAERTVYNGGPVWPAGAPDWVLHHRSDQLMLVPANPVPPALPRRKGVFIWGGQVHRQFGHQVAEYSTRVPQSLRDGPAEGRFLFTLWPQGKEADIPAHFWSVMDWYGVPRARIEFVTSGFVAASLWVAPQPEQLGGPGPSDEFLDLLARTESARGLRPTPTGPLYVSREGMLRRCLGTWAGEGYLSSRLAELGVRVIRPEDMPLNDQLAAYAAASTAIFADGSALHGRQLLGFHPQTIAVITRRPRGKLAEHMIAPRCDRVHYLSRPQGTIQRVIADGRPDSDRALALYDETSLLEAFGKLGLDLAPVWDSDAFRKARDADVEIWLRAVFQPQRQTNPGFDWPATYIRVREDIAACGLQHLMPAVCAHARPPSAAHRLKRRLRHVGGPIYRRLRDRLGRGR